MQSNIIDALTSALGEEKVSTDPALLKTRQHDYWVVSHLKDFTNQTTELPGVVAQPHSVADVQAIVKLANETGTPLIPFGLGSGVCGGVIANQQSILLDMSKMNAVRNIDQVNMLASFDAGKNGLEAEQAVAEAGMTIGHWPQSIAVSSVGGWVATRASGQFSTAYGNIEDIIYSIEAVLPNGEVIVAGKAPRAAAGPDLRQLLLGSEGTLAIITGVTFSLRRQAPSQAYSAYLANTMQEGIALQREIVQSGWQPPVMRQYDGTETRRSFADVARDDAALLFMIHEGPAAAVQVEKDAIEELALAAGLTPVDEQVAVGWLSQRNHVVSWDTFFEQKLVVDTIEISSSWDKIDAIYADAVKRLKDIPGVLNASAHSSHVYRSGINLYFSFAAVKDEMSELEPVYFKCWEAVMEATADNGGGVAHHHGIGRVRSPYLQRDLGDSGVALLRTVKQAIDPKNIMNPGVLLPNA